jgi:hypothetical protein
VIDTQVQELQYGWGIERLDLGFVRYRELEPAEGVILRLDITSVSLGEDVYGYHVHRGLVKRGVRCYLLKAWFVDRAPFPLNWSFIVTLISCSWADASFLA